MSTSLNDQWCDSWHHPAMVLMTVILKQHIRTTTAHTCPLNVHQDGGNWWECEQCLSWWWQYYHKHWRWSAHSHLREYRPSLPHAHGHSDPLHAGRFCIPGGRLCQGQEHHQHSDQKLLRPLFWYVYHILLFYCKCITRPELTPMFMTHYFISQKPLISFIYIVQLATRRNGSIMQYQQHVNL